LSPGSVSSRRQLFIAVEFSKPYFRESKKTMSRVHRCQGPNKSGFSVHADLTRQMPRLLLFPGNIFWKTLRQSTYLVERSLNPGSIICPANIKGCKTPQSKKSTLLIFWWSLTKIPPYWYVGGLGSNIIYIGRGNQLRPDLDISRRDLSIPVEFSKKYGREIIIILGFVE
jgi:hypothetical protein